jgi:hypothetical protein
VYRQQILSLSARADWQAWLAWLLSAATALECLRWWLNALHMYELLVN